jgi:hypothetical protein
MARAHGEVVEDQAARGCRAAARFPSGGDRSAPLDPGRGIALRRWLFSLGSAIPIEAPEALDKLALEQQRHLS